MRKRAKKKAEKRHMHKEIYSLDMAFAQYVVPRLILFKERHCDHPSDLTNDEWDNVLDKMIIGFRLISKDTLTYTDKENKDIETGLDLFRKYYQDLWC